MTMTTMKSAALVVTMLLLGLSPAFAGGNLVRRAERLPTLTIEATHGFSMRDYAVETGAYYRWRIRSDGRDEYRLLAPELFRNAWIQRVSVEEIDVEPVGLGAITFDGEGVVDIWLVPIRPGDYRFYLEGLAGDGFAGVFHVR